MNARNFEYFATALIHHEGRFYAPLPIRGKTKEGYNVTLLRIGLTHQDTRYCIEYYIYDDKTRACYAYALGENDVETSLFTGMSLVGAISAINAHL